MLPQPLQNLLGRFRADLAIDLGTANTLICVTGEGLVLNEPSVVAVEQSSGRILSGGCAVGHLAKQMEGRTPDSISVVRPLHNGVISDFELCEAMLRYFLRKAQRPGWRLRPRVLVGIPGCITPVEKRAVFNSVHRAGAGAVWVMPEAKAAAIGAGLPLAEPLASMVCDIGGGTTEVAIMSLGDTVAAQSVRTGGDRMDQAIVDYLRRHYSLRIGQSAAERLKIDIGSAFPLEEERAVELSGVDAVSGLPRKVTITSEEVRRALGDPLPGNSRSYQSLARPLQSRLGRRSDRQRPGSLRRRGPVAADRPLHQRANRPARAYRLRAAFHRGQGAADLHGAFPPLAPLAPIQRRRCVSRREQKSGARD